MLIRKYVIPLLAVVGAIAAVRVVISENQPVQPTLPVAEPAKSPFTSQIAGAGLVEASTQNIAIGTNLAGIVSKVHVTAGDKVKAGQPLFEIDDRQTRADLAVREAALLAAQRNLERLESLPRKEEIPPVEARLAESVAQRDDARDQLTRIEKVEDRRAVTDEEMKRRKFAVLTAESRTAEAQAALDLLKAGAWKPELEIARANVASAKAELDAVKTELDRLVVKAPVDGQVLQSNIRTGEFAQAGALSTPLMLLGNTDTLHVRVDIDENDAWRFRPESKAIASLRGNSSLKTDLRFVRVEPYVIPKRSLTGESSERVDTRVLQALYAFPRESLPVFVGQQMDVFIDAPPVSGAASAAKPGQS